MLLEAAGKYYDFPLTCVCPCQTEASWCSAGGAGCGWRPSWPRGPSCGSRDSGSECWGRGLWHICWTVQRENNTIQIWQFNYKIIIKISAKTNVSKFPKQTWRCRGSWWTGRTCPAEGRPGRWAGWSRPAGGRTRWGRGGWRWTDWPAPSYCYKVL